MNMKLLSFSLKTILLVTTMAVCAPAVNAQVDSTTANKMSFMRRYDNRHKDFQKGWRKLIPQQAIVQMYGDIGLLSLGAAWDYGKREQWETSALVGYVPKYNADQAHATLTLKQTYIPWSFTFYKNLAFEPLSAGAFLNLIFGDGFWIKEPDTYPYAGYYGFMSRLRINIFLGEQLTFTLPKEKNFFAKNLSLYYEISTYDLMLISRVTNSSLRPRQFLRLGFGVKVKML